MSGDSHPARKLDQGELLKVLAELNQDVPALRSNVVAQEFSDIDPQTVRNNLDALADEDKICRFNDGDSKFYWIPRHEDEQGTIEYSELIDDSIDWEDIDISAVPAHIAEDIASERLPYYRPRSFWSKVINICQLGVIASFGVVVLGIGALVGGTLGVEQDTGALLFGYGLRFSLVFLIGYVGSTILDYLAAQGRISKYPPLLSSEHE